ncbi:MAG: 4-alpha-glucanotransferase [Syntrophothermus sp.]
MKERAGGILLHPTSLPGRFGIGTLGNAAYDFIDFLVNSKIKFWQILPLGPTGYGDSPYQCFSSRAGNPMLIDPEMLHEERLITKEELDSLELPETGHVDYGRVITLKYAVLEKAYERFRSESGKELKQDLRYFSKSNSSWLNDYALFMSIKEHNKFKPWYKWTKSLRLKKEEAVAPLEKALKSRIEFHKFIQYMFFRQWSSVKDYANENNIRIIGDIPLYVALDSADAWANPELFEFNQEKMPVAVGGVPPDYFSENGQLWGNPLYNWYYHKQQRFKWWTDRINFNLSMFDMIRIDHFRGFAAYWAVPAGEETARNGKWMPGPGKDLFETIYNQLGELPIIAEDLGVITPDVENLRDSFGFPGMKILQFAFDSAEANDYLPHNYPKNSVVYTGTHDNDTVKGWFEKASAGDRKQALDYMGCTPDKICSSLIRLAWSSVSNTAVVPLQDLLELGSEARMNTPGTTSNNWKWRCNASDFNPELAKRLSRMAKMYGRD